MYTTLYNPCGDTLYNAVQFYTILYKCIHPYTAPRGIPYTALYSFIKVYTIVYSFIQPLGGYPIQRYTNLYSSIQVCTALYNPYGETLYSAYNSIQPVGGYTGLYNFMQRWTALYTCIQLYTAPMGIPYTALCAFTLVYTALYSRYGGTRYSAIQLYTILYNSIQRYTIGTLRQLTGSVLFMSF